MEIQVKSSNNLLPNALSKNLTNDKINLSILIPVYNERHLVAASVNRVLALKSDLISRLEVIIVDDCSQDGSWNIIQQIAAHDERVRAVRQKHNQGKGAAIRTARDLATGDVCVVHDADMEYDPIDLPALLVPFIEEGADAVLVRAISPLPTGAP